MKQLINIFIAIWLSLVVNLLVSCAPKTSSSGVGPTSAPVGSQSPQVITQNTAAADGGGVIVGGGGGGVKKGDVPLTFYSAGLYSEPINQVEQVPNLHSLVNYILNEMDYLEPEVKTQLVGALYPSEKRKYIRLDAVNKETQSKLLHEFTKVTALGESDLVLFAITDPKSKNTFLLPEFFKLQSANQQMAILFHEAYWIQHPESTYQNIVAVEKSFQAILEKPENYERKMDFVKKFAGPVSQLRLAILTDIRSGALKPLLASGTSLNSIYISIESVFGRKFLECGGTPICIPTALPHLSWVQKTSGSKFVELLMDEAASGQLKMIEACAQREDTFLWFDSAIQLDPLQKSDKLSVVYLDEKGNTIRVSKHGKGCPLLQFN